MRPNCTNGNMRFQTEVQAYTRLNNKLWNYICKQNNNNKTDKQQQ